MSARWREEWTPPWAPAVVGSYEMPRRFDDQGMPEVQWIEMRCTSCHATHRLPCTSGNVRQRIAQFALLHVHRDPLHPQQPAPTSTRGSR